VFSSSSYKSVHLTFFDSLELELCGRRTALLRRMCDPVSIKNSRVHHENTNLSVVVQMPSHLNKTAVSEHHVGTGMKIASSMNS